MISGRKMNVFTFELISKFSDQQVYRALQKDFKFV